MPSFLRRRSAATPGTSPAPVVAPAPVAPPISRPVSPAPAPVVSAPGTPNLSDAITQLKGGNRQSAEAMMRQIVGLPPLPASPSEPVYTSPGELEPQPAIPPPGDGTVRLDYFGPGGRARPSPNINRPITNMPVPDPRVAAPYPQAPFGNPAKSQMGMQAYLDQQNLLAQKMNQQRNPMAGPNPYMQQARAIPLGMQVQQPSYMQSPEFQGYQTQAQDLQRQMEQYMQKAPMYQQLQDLQGKMQQAQQQYMSQQQPYMPQMGPYAPNDPRTMGTLGGPSAPMSMDMPQRMTQAYEPMPEFPPQPYQTGNGMEGFPPNRQQPVSTQRQPMPEFPPQPMDDGTIMGRATNMMSRAGVFGNPQQMGPQSPMQQPASPAANMMSNAGFGSQVSSAFGSNMQPMQQRQFGMQQQPMGQFQQNNAQQMSNFQNQNQNQGNQNPGNQNQNRGGMFGRGFGGGGGNSGGGGGGGLF